MLAPAPNGLSPEGMIVLAMSIMATIMFITEPIPLPAVALLIILGQDQAVTGMILLLVPV